MTDKYRVHEIVKFNYSDIGEYIDENHTDRPLRNDILVELLNELNDENKELKMKVNFYKDFQKDARELEKENNQLKKELLIYRRIASCSNCEYQNYDWFDDGDEFEVCEKGNNEQQIDYHICKEWREI